ncbi:PDDEXK-like family protein [Aquiflexum lacus]|uniref:PDDEXK-like family protein n=1 Tax=Aquiflexum lacus TaxID=2483805 RepID=UPI0021D120DA|nr:PD-(D/E)XK nuclease family protein [Aquiflexum lacus]
MPHQRVKTLLSKIRDIKLKSEELARLRGEIFNIFKILKLEGSESTLHTTLITELLNPKGTHGYNDLFLKAFINRLNEDLNLDITDEFHQVGDGVKKEKYISPVNYIFEEGGLLDIFIQTDKFVIGIENKIFSDVGFLQLERYRKFLNSFQTNHINSYLIYLTLEGRHSESKSLKLNEDYYPVSYKRFIIKWLEECHSIVSDSPILRETIKQYVITIQYLTNQLTSHKMEEELEKLLSEYYDEAQLVAANIGKVQNTRTIKLYTIVKSKVTQKLPKDWEMVFDLNVLNFNWNQISFRQNWVEGLSVSFEGTPKFINGFGHGILLSTEKFDKNLIKSELSEKIKFNKRTNSWMTYNAGLYSQLSSKVNSSTNLDTLAEEISDYMLRVIEGEKNACEIINNHLIT